MFYTKTKKEKYIIYNLIPKTKKEKMVKNLWSKTTKNDLNGIQISENKAVGNSAQNIFRYK